MSARVLIADGDADRAKRIAEHCSGRGLDCGVAPDGARALERVLAEGPAVLAARVDLPVIPGAKLAAILEANPRTREVAVVLLDETGGRAGSHPGGRPAVASDPETAGRAIVALIAERSRRQASARQPGEGGGIAGELSELPLADLLQLFYEGRKTGTVEVLPPRDGGARSEGRIYLCDGDVTQAGVGLVAGEKALYRLLRWDRGRFAFKPGPVAVPAGIETPTRALLREGRRQLAEWEKLALELPPLEGLVSLRVPRSRLPNVIHPLTQEVLVVLELYARVRDVVDHCSYPDYQVLRTLQTLIARGLVELRREPEGAESGPEAAAFSRGHADRLREWLAAGHPRGAVPRAAKLAVLAPSPEVRRQLMDLMAGLPGLALDPAARALGPDDLAPLARLAVGPELAVELFQVPVAERFAPLWSVAVHGALATLIPVAAPVERAAAALRGARAALGALPRSRLFYLLLLARGARPAPEVLREHLALLDDGPLFLIPQENPEKSRALLREMFRRVLP